MSKKQSCPYPEPKRIPLRAIMRPLTIFRLLLAWGTVLLFMTIGASWFEAPFSPLSASLLFAILFIVILYLAFGVVREADKLAHSLGEPYGTLILTLSIVSIEVILISSVMLGPNNAPTIGKDAIFSVMMIILNLIIGLSIILGSLKYDEQEYNVRGAMLYNMLILVFGISALILPNYLGHDNAFLNHEAILMAFLILGLYGTFLFLQTTTISHYFIQPPQGRMDVIKKTVHEPMTPKMPADIRMIILRTIILIGLMVPIVLLSHNMAIIIDYGIAAIGAPTTLGGLIIAIIVFTPESITTLIAARHNEMARVVNLCLGAFLSTVGLTVPAVLIIGLITGKTVSLGLTQAETVLFILTIILSMMTFSGRRSTLIVGLAHLFVFMIYVIQLFS